MPDTQRRTTLKGLAIAMGAAALPGCATSPPTSAAVRPGDNAQALAQLDTWVRNELGRHRGANLSVAVLDGDRIAWSQAYGLADPTRQLLATDQTVYRAGSVSKVFTTMAVMQLAEQGRIDLDAPLQDVLPSFKVRSRFSGTRPVTPRLILQHRSGLPSDRADGMWSDAPQTLDQLVLALRDEYLSFPPGEMQSYCNLGFSLLGAAIEHITAEPFARWMQTRLLEPMGMGRSAFEIAPPRGPQAAIALDPKGKSEPEPGLRDVSAGGLNSTVIDLLQLGRLWFSQGKLNGRQILSPSSMASMATPASAPILSDVAVLGLGWHLLDEELDGVGPLLWHAGGTPHHHAQLMLLPQLKLGVAVMSSAAHAGELAQEAALKALALMAAARTGADPVRALRQGKDPMHPPAPLSRLQGHYDTPIGVVQIEGKDHKASVRAMGKRLDLRPNADGYARLGFQLFGLFPINLGRLGEMAFTQLDQPDGQVWLLVRRKGRFILIGNRLQPVPIPPAWRLRLGTYRYTGGDPFLAQQFKAVRLIEDAGLLLAEVEAGPESTRLALAPVDDEQAIVRGLGRGRGDTVLARQEGAETVLYANGMRFVRQAGA